MILTLEGGSHRIKMKFNRNKYTQQLKKKKSMQIHDKRKCKNAEDCMKITDDHRSKTRLET